MRALLPFLPLATGSFLTPLANLTANQSVNLTWSSVSSAPEPYILTLALLNQTSTDSDSDSDSGSVFGLKANLSTALAGTSFQWTDIPYPAPFMATAIYQLEVKSYAGVSVAQSEWFGIGEGGDTGGDRGGGSGGDGQGSDEGSGDGDDAGQGQEGEGGGGGGGGGGVNKVAIAVGVVVGVFGVMALGVVAWCLRRRRRRAKEEMRRRKRLDFVIS